MNRFSGAAVLTSALLLAACATPGTERAAATAATAAAAEASVAAAWQAPLPAAGATDLAHWWARFDDPLLPQLVASAHAASPTLAAAAARIERARASRVAAEAALLPHADAVASASLGRATLGQPVASSASLGVQAGWEVDLFGANAAGRNAARARLEAAQAGWHAAAVAVAAEVATSYTALRACEAQGVQSRADADSRAETSRLTELSANAGFTAPADAALARAGAAQSRSQAVSQRAACDTLVKSLVELTAIAEPDLRRQLAAATAVVPRPAPVGPGALPAALLAQRPDLAEAERNVIAAAGDRAQALARQKPQVGLGGSLFGVGVRSNEATTSGTTWTLGPLTVSFPLFDGGARRAATAAAQAGYDEAVALYRGQIRRAVREVEAALVALQASTEREADALLAAQDFDASLRATEARQKGGLASLFDLESARRNAVQAQVALIDLRRERAAAAIALYRALGGGWNDATLTAAAP